MSGGFGRVPDTVTLLSLAAEYFSAILFYCILLFYFILLVLDFVLGQLFSLSTLSSLRVSSDSWDRNSLSNRRVLSLCC